MLVNAARARYLSKLRDSELLAATKSACEVLQINGKGCFSTASAGNNLRRVRQNPAR
jgi:hypothetical protein